MLNATPDIEEAQRLMDELFRQGYRIPAFGECRTHYGMTFFGVKTGAPQTFLSVADTQILRWVENYTRLHGDPPTQKSGLVGEADSGTLKWGAVDRRLRKRGLSLSLFCVHHGIRASVSTTESQMLGWVQKFRDRTGELPTEKSGLIGEVDSGHLTWNALQHRIGSTLFRFYVKHGLRAPPVEPSTAQALVWVKNYTKRHGCPPTLSSGLIGEADSGDLTWGALSYRLKARQGLSLLEFCVKHGLRDTYMEISDTQILRWAKNHIKKYGVPPAQKPVLIGEPDSGNYSWATLDAKIRKKGSSIHQFCVDHGLREIPVEVSEDRILRWAKTYLGEHGKTPTTTSGLVGRPDSGGITWQSVENWLRKHGSTLSRFCVKHGLREATVEVYDARVLKWVESYTHKNGTRPTTASGLIGELDSGTLSWRTLDQRLRGQDRPSSLLRFCRAHNL